MNTGAMSGGSLSAAVWDVISRFGVRQKTWPAAAAPLKDVEHGARQAAFLQRGRERRFVDHAAAARIDEHGARRQRAQKVARPRDGACPGRRHDAHQVVEIRGERGALTFHRTVEPRVHVGAVLAGARVALHGHAEVFRRARDRRARSSRRRAARSCLPRSVPAAPCPTGPPPATRVSRAAGVRARGGRRRRIRTSARRRRRAALVRM
jgi:hypothetical protein